MDTSVLAPWRDLSIAWLGLLTMIFVALPGIALYFAVRGVRWLIRWLKRPLLLAHVWALRIQRGTARAADGIAEGVIRAHARAEQTRVTTRGVIDYLRGG